MYRKLVSTARFIYLFTLLGSSMGLASSEVITDPIKYAEHKLQKIFTVHDCEQFNVSSRVIVSCSSEVFETDLPCADPNSPSGLEMCYGVEVYQSCDFEFTKKGQHFQLISGPICDIHKVEDEV